MSEIASELGVEPAGAVLQLVDKADGLTSARGIADLDGLVRRVLIYLGLRKLRTEDGIDIWPIAEWLEAIDDGRLWP
ncbi:MAG TPA: hypothetical protein VD833_12055 [Vicinamibacterales bacterium]|nr:hypothetical protein [Vicinamibacterales bacterium]